MHIMEIRRLNIAAGARVEFDRPCLLVLFMGFELGSRTGLYLVGKTRSDSLPQLIAFPKLLEKLRDEQVI